MLLVADSDVRRVVPLATLGIVGRGAACLVRVEHPTCPSHWVELCWRGDRWAWRMLNAEDRTRAAGPFLSEGWRAMNVYTDRGTRISLGTSVWIELVDAGPPEPFAWDLLAGTPVMGEALEQVAERRGDALLPLDAEGDAKAALRDGQCWLVEGPDGPRPLRAHVPVSVVPTLSSRLDLAEGRVVVEVDLSAETAVFTQRGVEVSIASVTVRTLLLYARERAGGSGWVTAAEARAAWTELGGGAAAPQEVVAWERARLRRLLDRARVGSVGALFDTRKERGFVRVRLGDVVTDVITVG